MLSEVTPLLLEPPVFHPDEYRLSDRLLSD